MLIFFQRYHWLRVTTVITILGAMVIWLWSPSFILRAGSGSTSETFGATTNRDGTNTTGQWTGNGVARGTASRSWSEISTGMESSDVAGITGTANTFYAVANGSGVFKTTNAGTSWTKLSGLPDRGAQSLAGLTSDINIIAVGLQDGRLVKTTNGGTSWTTTTVTASGQLINTVRTITFSPNYTEAGTDKTIFVGGFATGIYKSTDGGTNWSRINTGLPANATINEIRAVPTYHEVNGPKTVFATLSAAGAGAIYKSTDGGSNWTNVTPSGFASSTIDGLAIEQTCDINATCRVAAGNQDGKVVVSSNAGSTWGSAVQVATGSNLVSSLAYTPDTTDTVLFATTNGGDGIFRSADHGTTWTNINAGGGVVTPINGQSSVNDLAFNTNNGNTVLAGTQGGGVFISTNTNGGAVTWAEVNSGLTAPLVRDLARVNDSDSDDTNDVLYAGTDAGLYKTTNGGSSWTRQAYSDYGAAWNRHVVGVEVDPDDATNVLIAAQYHGLYRSTNSGTSFTRVYPSAAVLSAGGGKMRIAFAPNNSTVFAVIDGTASGGRVIRSTDNGATWTGVDTSTINVNTLEGLAISPSHTTDSTVFVVTSSGGLFRSTDNGATWSAVTVTVSSTTYTNFVSLALSPNYNQAVANDCSADAATCTLYVGTSAGLVFRSTNKGSTWSQVYSNSGGNTIESLIVSPTTQDTSVIAGPQSGPLVAADDGATFATSATYMAGLTDSTGFGDGYQTVSPKDFLLHPSYLTNQSLWMATTAGVFKMIPTYTTAGIIQSGNLLSSAPSTKIRSVVVTPTATTPTGTSITYQLAAGQQSGWSAETTGFSGDIFTVEGAGSVGEYFMAGASGTARKKVGGTWSAISLPAGVNSRTFYRVVGAENAPVFSVGASGLVTMSPDSGSPALISLGTSNNLFSADYDGTTTVVIVGQNGVIYRATGVQNNGTVPTFTAISSPTTNTLYSIESMDGGILVAVGANGTVIRSTNSGVSWATVSSGTTYELRAIKGGGGTMTAVGLFGTAIASNDSGATWAVRTTGTSEHLYAVASESGATYVAGNNGTILKTADTITWTAQTFNGLIHFRGLASTSANNVLAVGINYDATPRDTAYLTTNGGTTGSDAFISGTQSGSDYNFTFSVVPGFRQSFKTTLNTTATVTPALNTLALAYTTNTAPTASPSSPIASASGISQTPTLQASYSDSDSDTQNAAQWQITTTSGTYSGSALVYNSGVDPSNLTSITVPANILNSCTPYYWRVRFRDLIGSNYGDWGDYSTERSFTTTNCGSSPATQQLQAQQPLQDIAPQATKPSAPTNTACAALSATSIRCTYQRVGSANSFELRRGTVVLGQTANGTAAEIILTGLTPNTLYADLSLYTVWQGLSSNPASVSAVATFAQDPTISLLERLSSQQVRFKFSGQNNPVATEYAIEIEPSSPVALSSACLSPAPAGAGSERRCQYVTASSIFDAAPIWRTLADWQTGEAPVVIPATSGDLTVLARNRAAIIQASPPRSVPPPLGVATLKLDFFVFRDAGSVLGARVSFTPLMGSLLASFVPIGLVFLLIALAVFLVHYHRATKHFGSGGTRLKHFWHLFYHTFFKHDPATGYARLQRANTRLSYAKHTTYAGLAHSSFIWALALLVTKTILIGGLTLASSVPWFSSRALEDITGQEIANGTPVEYLAVVENIGGPLVENAAISVRLGDGFVYQAGSIRKSDLRVTDAVDNDDCRIDTAREARLIRCQLGSLGFRDKIQLGFKGTLVVTRSQLVAPEACVSSTQTPSVCASASNRVIVIARQPPARVVPPPVPVTEETSSTTPTATSETTTTVTPLLTPESEPTSPTTPVATPTHIVPVLPVLDIPVTPTATRIVTVTEVIAAAPETPRTASTVTALATPRPEPSAIPVRIPVVTAAQDTAIVVQSARDQDVSIAVNGRVVAQGADGERVVVNLLAIPEGTHSVTIRTVDQDGSERDVTRTMIVDRTAPAAPVTVVSARAQAQGSDLAQSVSGVALAPSSAGIASGVRAAPANANTVRRNDAGEITTLHRFSYAGVTQAGQDTAVFLVQSDPQTFACATDGPTWNCSFETFLPVGSHAVAVAARDAAGNQSSFTPVEQIAVRPPACVDGADNDNDGLIDFPEDPGCSSYYGNDESNILPESAAKILAAVAQPVVASKTGQAIIAVQQDTQELVTELQENVAVVATVREDVAPVATTASAAPFISVLALNNLGLLDIPNVLVFYFLWLLERLHLRKRRQPAGRVYDAVDKSTLPMAKVRVYSIKEQRFVASMLADMKGMYGLPSLAGGDSYYLQITKPSYSFPTNLVRAKVDHEYHNIYRGETFSARVGDLKFDVPLDPVATRPRARWRARLADTWSVLVEGFHLLANILLGVGALISLGMYFIVPKPWHLLLFALYLILAVLAYLSQRAKNQPRAAD